jgi:hypothetical protein
MTMTDEARRDLLKTLAALGLGGLTSNAMAAAESVDVLGGKVIFENEKVRVIAHQSRPRMGVCGSGLHSHPPHLTIVLTDTKAKVTLAGKDPFMVENKAGDVFWDPGGPHAVENLGSRDSKVYLVEIKSA